MASSSSLLSEEQFLCSICLDVFTEPVSTSCGHNFCMACVTKYWNGKNMCQCPLCQETFSRRPKLHINATFREVVENFKKTRDRRKDGHKLIDPVVNLEDRICKKHDRLLELFCRTDQTCVCQFCTETDHKTHDTVPIEEESGERKVQLGKTEAEVQLIIQGRLKKVKDIKFSVDLSKRDAEREIADSIKVFTALVRSIEKSQAELIEVIEERQKAVECQAEGLIKELEQEITELKRRSTELKQLSHTEDHLQLLQSFSSRKTDWDVGVARQPKGRKVNISPSSAYRLWTVSLRDGNSYKACTFPPVFLSLREKPQKVGVFVDYEEGQVSFYDVEARSHIYSFTGCTFTEKLYPFFSPCMNAGGKNSAPLIISPVIHTH
ncbi:unnamed protein product [Oncorhynchus mykiss]|uniref:Uncharacterized protein n=1 Tax=Oncorhynchus mykiss TaxID=8022 RepID=A0A060XRP5_ONCMY|nr:unnamed protein product [Oncorhynchus mykiss]